jgi:hypothetical protein
VTFCCVVSVVLFNIGSLLLIAQVRVIVLWGFLVFEGLKKKYCKKNENFDEFYQIL